MEAETFSEFNFVGGEDNASDELISNASQILAEQDVKVARLGGKNNGATSYVEAALGGKLVGKFDISAVNPHIDAVSMNESIWTVTNNARADWTALVDLDEETLPPFHPVPLTLTTAVTSSGKDAGTSSFTWNGTAAIEIPPPPSNQEANFIAIQIYGRSTSGSSYANLILSDEETGEQIATMPLISGNERVGHPARRGYGIVKVFEIPRFSLQKRVAASVSVLKLRRSDASSIVIGFGSPTVFVATRATKYTPVWTADVSPHENEGLFLTVLPPRNSFIPSGEVKAVVVPLGTEAPVRKNGGAVPNMGIVLNSTPTNPPDLGSGETSLAGPVGKEQILELDFDPKIMAFSTVIRPMQTGYYSIMPATKDGVCSVAADEPTILQVTTANDVMARGSRRRSRRMGILGGGGSGGADMATAATTTATETTRQQFNEMMQTFGIDITTTPILGATAATAATATSPLLQTGGGDLEDTTTAIVKILLGAIIAFAVAIIIGIVGYYVVYPYLASFLNTID